MATELVFDERPPARPDDPAPERLAAFQAKIAACGGLEAAVKAKFAELDFSGVDLSALEGTDSLLWRWREWAEAAQKVREQCAHCDGAAVAGYRSPPDDCQRPIVLENGSVGQERCPKREQAMRAKTAKAHLAACGIPRRFLDCTLDGFETSADPRLVEAVRAVQGFIASLGAGSWGEDDGLGSKGLLLMGPVGTGKTFLATAALKALVERGFAGWYMTVADLLARLRAAIAEERVESVVAAWRKKPIIVLDDLGKEYLPPGAAGKYVSAAWAHEELFRLIDHRYAGERPMIVTTNLDADALKKRYDLPLVSRLRECCTWVTLDVPDHRAKVAS